MGRRALSLLLFVAGYVMLATLSRSWRRGAHELLAARLVLTRESEPARI